MLRGGKGLTQRTSPLWWDLAQRVLAAIGFAICLPLMGAAAVAIRVESGSPALFRQTRVGMNERPFMLYKLRTMRTNATIKGPSVTSAGDSRVTRVGRLLRRSKIDELPQLINVVKGEMNLVGPRPELPKYVEIMGKDDRQVLFSVKPGITDPVTLELVAEEALLGEQADPEQFYVEELLPQKVRGYREFLSTRSVRGDVQLLFRTIGVVAVRSATAAIGRGIEERLPRRPN